MNKLIEAEAMLKLQLYSNV